MASFNKVILMGNLTRDPQVRYTPGGTAVTDIGLAVNRVWYDKQTQTRKEETTFVDVTLWGRQAEVAGEYLSKGRSVLIEGRLQLDQWDDRETGQKRSKLKVVGENMTMVGGRSDAQPRSSAPADSADVAEQQDFASQQNVAAEETTHDRPAGNVPDEDVPF